MASALQPFQTFLENAVNVVQPDPETIGLAVGGSYASSDTDAYSDLDLVLVTAKPIAPDLGRMRTYASRLGQVLASFRGDHVGEPRLLIALYDAPLLHVDIKFLTLAEFYERVENPLVLYERDEALTTVIRQSTARYPAFDFQGIEDRFWIWMHYATLKIGRGEYFEALDFLSFVRGTVLGPMVHLKNRNGPRGVRRIETSVVPDDVAQLSETVASLDRKALLGSVEAAMRLYESLRDRLAPVTLRKNGAAQSAVQLYFDAISTQNAFSSTN